MIEEKGRPYERESPHRRTDPRRPAPRAWGRPPLLRARRELPQRHVRRRDFGICLIDDGRERNTAAGEVVGPPVFMAPELEGGGQLDVTAAADVYSLGKVIFFLLTGGVRLPRENLGDQKYSAVLSGAGLEG